MEGRQVSVFTKAIKKINKTSVFERLIETITTVGFNIPSVTDSRLHIILSSLSEISVNEIDEITETILSFWVQMINKIAHLHYRSEDIMIQMVQILLTFDIPVIGNKFRQYRCDKVYLILKLFNRHMSLVLSNLKHTKNKKNIFRNCDQIQCVAESCLSDLENPIKNTKENQTNSVENEIIKNEKFTLNHADHSKIIEELLNLLKFKQELITDLKTANPDDTVEICTDESFQKITLKLAEEKLEISLTQYNFIKENLTRSYSEQKTNTKPINIDIEHRLPYYIYSPKEVQTFNEIHQMIVDIFINNKSIPPHKIVTFINNMARNKDIREDRKKLFNIFLQELRTKIEVKLIPSNDDERTRVKTHLESLKSIIISTILEPEKIKSELMQLLENLDIPNFSVGEQVSTLDELLIMIHFSLRANDKNLEHLSFLYMVLNKFFCSGCSDDCLTFVEEIKVRNQKIHYLHSKMFLKIQLIKELITLYKERDKNLNAALCAKKILEELDQTLLLINAQVISSQESLTQMISAQPLDFAMASYSETQPANYNSLQYQAISYSLFKNIKHFIVELSTLMPQINSTISQEIKKLLEEDIFKPESIDHKITFHENSFRQKYEIKFKKFRKKQNDLDISVIMNTTLVECKVVYNETNELKSLITCINELKELLKNTASLNGKDNHYSDLKKLYDQLYSFKTNKTFHAYYFLIDSIGNTLNKKYPDLCKVNNSKNKIDFLDPKLTTKNIPNNKRKKRRTINLSTPVTFNHSQVQKKFESTSIEDSTSKDESENQSNSETIITDNHVPTVVEEITKLESARIEIKEDTQGVQDIYQIIPENVNKKNDNDNEKRSIDNENKTGDENKTNDNENEEIVTFEYKKTSTSTRNNSTLFSPTPVIRQKYPNYQEIFNCLSTIAIAISTIDGEIQSSDDIYLNISKLLRPHFDYVNAGHSINTQFKLMMIKFIEDLQLSYLRQYGANKFFIPDGVAISLLFWPCYLKKLNDHSLLDECSILNDDKTVNEDKFNKFETLAFETIKNLSKNGLSIEEDVIMPAVTKLWSCCILNRHILYGRMTVDDFQINFNPNVESFSLSRRQFDLEVKNFSNTVYELTEQYCKGVQNLQIEKQMYGTFRM